MLSPSLHRRLCSCHNVTRLLINRNLVTTSCLMAGVPLLGSGPQHECERMNRYMQKLTNRLSQKDLLHAKGVVVSQGAPNFLAQSKGHARTISRRQKMLSFHFAQGLTEVLAHEDINSIIKEYEVRVTHVEVGQHYNILNVFWTTTRLNRGEVAAKLNSIVGLLNKKMVEKNFMTLIPDIRFIFDTKKMSVDEVETVLRKTGLEPLKSKPQNFVPPTEMATGYKFVEMGPRIKSRRVALFVEEFKRSQENAFRDRDKVNIRPGKFTCPPDMTLDAFGLDYEKIMNQVMSTMLRSRSQCRQNVPTADPLPPAVWIEDHKMPTDHEKGLDLQPDTTVRLSTMRNFIIDHRRKRTKFFKEKEKQENEHLDSIAEDHLYVMENLYSGDTITDGDNPDVLDEDDIHAAAEYADCSGDAGDPVEDQRT